jgi:ApaG protein
MSDNYLPIAPIHIEVETHYLPEQSIPMQHRYTFAYQITIRNDGKTPMTLRRRYWQITDDNQKVEVVQGAGVVGQQPTLDANEAFIYASGAQLSTPYGQMEGYYVFEDAQGHAYRAPIAPFLLSIPRTLH